MQTPVDSQIVRQQIAASGLNPVGLASIRELNGLVSAIETQARVQFIRMEMGIPGLDPPKIAVDAEIQALQRGVGATYPPFEGIGELKSEISALVKNFLDVDVAPQGCIPTVGSMQGTFLSLLTTAHRIKNRTAILFIDPGFPVNKRQVQVLGLPCERFDIYTFRGDKLRAKLESYLRQDKFAAVLYSTPNNPSWICLTLDELQIIGELCARYDVTVLEDLAYFGMDFRTDYSRPGQAPFIPTAATYTDNYILIISSSKSFTLAGQRIGMVAISDRLYHCTADNLVPYFGNRHFGRAFIFGAMYAVSAGVSHSSQWALTALLRAVNSGEYDFVAAVKAYGRRAAVIKRLFTANGFNLVYDRDADHPLADGFYFTVAYPGMDGVKLVEELLYYGISAISLTTTGSDRHEGIRICVSQTAPGLYDLLEARLKQFDRAHR